MYGFAHSKPSSVVLPAEAVCAVCVYVCEGFKLINQLLLYLLGHIHILSNHHSPGKPALETRKENLSPPSHLVHVVQELDQPVCAL